MKTKYALYKGITIYHDSNLAKKYSFSYKTYNVRSDSFIKIKERIDSILTYEKVLNERTKRNNNG